MSSSLVFGIYAGGQVGTTLGAPDDPRAIASLVTGLQTGHPHPGGTGDAGARSGTQRPFLIREYLHHLGPRPDPEKVAVLRPARTMAALTMPDAWYTRHGRELDLVLSYQPETEDIDGWLEFITRVVARYGRIVRHLQVTLEPNFPIPWIDGSSPGALTALVRGTAHARRTLDAAGLGHVRVGFSVAEPAEWLGGDAEFWDRLAAVPAGEFARHVDYVGLGLYPDAFSPTPHEHLVPMVEHALTHLRTVSLPPLGLRPGTPVRICENGTPSTPDRSPEEQAARLETMIRTIASAAARHHVTHYELFALRDADSARPEATARFGLTTSDYRPKPAYETYRALIGELG
ncbi:hypothetical protein ACFYVL_03975 [Streptomyces sp. NPDC004111]|uniref:hypothetical protein n=1 Tax=Streptomyces sp. NPDC004111 TaxID=3364690 RepID=UPI0036BA5C89